MLVLDTAILINIERRDKKTIELAAQLSKTNPIAKITFMNRVEFLFGVHKKSPKNKERAIAFLDKFSVLHTTNETASILSELKARYAQKGLMIPLADLLIASLTIEHRATLVSADKIFERIDELKKIIIQ